jgi:hypothetical protein
MILVKGNVCRERCLSFFYLSQLTVCLADFGLVSDGPYQREWAYRFALVRDNGSIAKGGGTQ